MEKLNITPLGLVKDIDAISVNGVAWSGLVNMVTDVEGVRRVEGMGEVFPGAVTPPYYVQYTQQLAGDYWLYAGAVIMGVVDNAGNHADITPDGWGPVQRGDFTGGNLNGLAVINGIPNQPHYWYEGEPKAILCPGLRATNPRYRIVRPFKYHLVGLGVTDDNGAFLDQVHWSDGADPGQIPATWEPAAENEAGDNILADEDGFIIDGLALRDSFFIYKRNSVYEMTYVAGAETFRCTKLFGTMGVLTTNCIARVKGSHVVLGNGDIYQHDGQNQQSIVNAKIRDSFFSRIDDNNYETSFVVYDEVQEIVYFCVPTNGSEVPNFALLWNPITNEFGERELLPTDHGSSGSVGDASVSQDDTWDSGADTTWDLGSGNSWDSQPFNTVEDRALFALSGRDQFLVAGDGVQLDDVGYVSSVQVMGLDMGDDNVIKGVRRLWARLQSAPTARWTIRVYGADDPVTAPALLQEIVGSDLPIGGQSLDVNARYIGLEIVQEDSVDWSIQGLNIHYERMGMF